ncbi:MAG: hypothetical protein RL885_25490 [Planctomycetota bacterium]
MAKLPLPGSGGLEVDLTPDALFQFGLAFLPLFQATITSGQGQTPNVTIPATFSGTGPSASRSGRRGSRDG